MSEVWLPVPDYPHYEVSDEGNVRSLDRVVARKDAGHGGTCRRKGALMTPQIWVAKLGRKQPYRRIKLSANGKARHFFVSTLVLSAHVGPKPFPEAVARHLDDDSLNDTLDNLAWGTYADNVADAVRNELRVPLRGERNGNTQLTEADVVAIRAAVSAGATRRGVAKRYGVNKSTVCDIVNRKTWPWLTTESEEA